jgi:hypothetical protein
MPVADGAFNLDDGWVRKGAATGSSKQNRGDSTPMSDGNQTLLNDNAPRGSRSCLTRIASLSSSGGCVPVYSCSHRAPGPDDYQCVVNVILSVADAAKETPLGSQPDF